jgi:hypothetical protein
MDPRLWIGLALLIPAVLPALILREAVFQGNGIWIAVGELALLIASAVLIRMAERSQRRSLQQKQSSQAAPDTADLEAALDQLKALSDRSRKELSIPQDALNLDVLPFVYKRKDAGRKNCLSGNRFDNKPLWIWRQGSNICLSDYRVVLTIPQEDIQGRITYAKPFTVGMWLKETHFTNGQYKPYHIRPAGLLACRAHTYYGVVIGQGNGTDYEWLIPGYDWPQIEKLIHIPDLDALPKGNA